MIGIDYASVDGNAAPDFEKVKTRAAFAIIRKSFVLHDATHNAWHLAADVSYARDAARARAVGLTVGGYGFFAFGRNAPSAPDQVANLVHASGEAVRGKDLPLCIDVEFPGRGIADTGLTQRDAFAFLLELIFEVRRQTGRSPMIYTSHVQWHDDNGLGGPDSPELDGCPLWIKTPYRLRAGQPVDNVSPRLPHIAAAPDDPNGYWRVPTPWQRQGWWLQQCQGDAIGFPGFDATVDINNYQPLSSASIGEAPRVAWVQRHLGVSDDGIWGPITERALRLFQTSHGAEETGHVDIATFASLCG